MTEHICPSCHCSFKQEFLCTTCGAEKLKDETTKQLERALHSKAEALMAQTNEIERLRDLLGKANALCRIRQGRIKELVGCIELVCKIECVDDLWKVQAAIAKLGADKEAT